MRKSLIVLLVLTVFSAVRAEDGHQLWLRYQPINKAKVITTLQSPTIDIILQELESYYRGEAIALKLDKTMPDDDGYRFDGSTLLARRES